MHLRFRACVVAPERGCKTHWYLNNSDFNDLASRRRRRTQWACGLSRGHSERRTCSNAPLCRLLGPQATPPAARVPSVRKTDRSPNVELNSRPRVTVSTASLGHPGAWPSRQFHTISARARAGSRLCWALAFPGRPRRPVPVLTPVPTQADAGQAPGRRLLRASGHGRGRGSRQGQAQGGGHRGCEDAER